MFFILSKTLFYLLMPATWLCILIIWAYFSEKLRKRLILSAMIVFLFFSNGYFANLAMNCWEKQPIAIKEVKHRKLAVILTGVTNYVQKPYDRIYFNKGADRVLHPLMLYKKGLVDKILITGGDVKTKDTTLNESKQLREVLLLSGVKNEDIFLEDKAVNTRENALFSKPIIDKLVGQDTVYLVTSAFHMRRSEGCFTKVGVKFQAFPVDFSSNQSNFNLGSFFPTAKAFNQWEILFHEVLGYVVYKLIGYA